MLKKVIALALLVGVGLFAVGQIRSALRSPTEKLLWRVQTMVDDFNEGHVRHLMVGFGEDYRDESSGALKPEVHQVLAGLVLSQRDPEANRFALSAGWVEPFDPQLSEDEERATADVHLRITHTSRGNSRVWWEAKAKVEFAYVSGQWQLLRSRSVNHRDRQ
ncbi:MAG: hypothetical protein P1V35_12330 [Planctomycetota bacterium]|nr:hypothetical protein [Planctomycetota bacterium]